jgi:hypothetical protein
MCEMKRNLVVVGIAYVVAGLMFGSMALGSKAVTGGAMKVSPHTIVLGKVDTVTVHTGIAYDTVQEGTVTLEGAPANDVWADDCGDLAARWAVDDVLDGEYDPFTSVELTLKASYEDGGTFEATDTVRVK